MTFKKASKKRQFPKHKDRKQNNKKKKLGKIRLKTTEKKSCTKRQYIQDFKRNPTFANWQSHKPSSLFKNILISIAIPNHLKLKLGKASGWIHEIINLIIK
jgi:hypothetical protein